MLNRIRTRAFTLIELLVVVSIIALLVSILMPALGRARDQAKLVSCNANTKQIAQLVCLYQTDHDGFVPVVLNPWALQYAPPAGVNISVALRDYVDMKLPDSWSATEFNFGGPGRMTEYYENYLLEFFVCPFNRGKKYDPTQYWREESWVSIGSKDYKTYAMNTYAETYATHLWPKKKNDVIDEFTTGGGDGIRQYGVLNWWNVERAPTVGGKPNPLPNYEKLRPVAWGSRQLSATNASSLSEATIFYCGAGEFLGSSGAQTLDDCGIYNVGSHSKGGTGGTMAGFGDMHAEWVKGTRIGDR